MIHHSLIIKNLIFNYFFEEKYFRGYYSGGRIIYIFTVFALLMEILNIGKNILKANNGVIYLWIKLRSQIVIMKKAPMLILKTFIMFI